MGNILSGEIRSLRDVYGVNFIEEINLRAKKLLYALVVHISFSVKYEGIFQIQKMIIKSIAL